MAKKRLLKKGVKKSPENIWRLNIYTAQRIMGKRALIPGNCFLLILNGVKTMGELRDTTPEQLLLLDPLFNNGVLEQIKNMFQSHIFSNLEVPQHWKN